MIPITTPRGSFKVWTKRIGNNPRIKVLLLHGGPGITHEYFEAFDSYLPAEGIEYYYYDQLGSYYSDQPEMSDDCSRCHASSTRSNRSVRRSAWTPATSICSASRGAASWPSSTRCSTRTT